MAKVDWMGLDDIEGNLLNLGTLFADDLRSAANTGATVMKNEVALRAPRAKGILADNIYQKHIPELSGELRQVYYVSWRKGRKTGEGAYYGVWVEYGHWLVPPKPKGIKWKTHRDASKAVFVPAHPFIRPGYEARKHDVIDIMRAKLKINVQKTIADFYK